jgi:FixJ family two-component response regulator
MSASAQTGMIPTIHVVDDEDSFRTAIERLLKAAGYHVQTYSSGTEFIKSHGASGPGCILIDMYMPGLTGLDVQGMLASRGEFLPVVFISGRGDVPATVRAMQGGAADFLTKPVKKDVLLSTIASILARDADARSVREKAHEAQLLYQSLTPRQRSVFEGIIAGKLNKQMAIDLGIAERTIKIHRSHVMKKMRVQSVADLVRLSVELQQQGSAAPSRHR